MHPLKLGRPTPALVISLIALFVALGGTGYAALNLPKNSVGTKQLKKNAVTGAKVKNGSLFSKDFKAGQLPQGPQGLKGDTGTVGQTVTVIADTGPVSPNDDGTAFARCPDGYQAIGGGIDPQNFLTTVVTENTPILVEPGTLAGRPIGLSDGKHGVARGWQGTIRNNDPSNSKNAKVTAVCARG